MITYYRTPDDWGSVNIIGTEKEIESIISDLKSICKMKDISINECLKGYRQGNVIVFEEVAKKWTQEFIYSLDGYFLECKLIERP